MSAPGGAPRVLAMVEWYLPGQNAGGPVRSIDALVHRLEGRVHFDIVARDRDFGERAPYPQLQAGVWLDGRPGRRRYLRRRDERPLAVLALLRRTRHDVLYVNTLYSCAFALYPLAFRRLRLLRTIRIVVAPRGQLDDGALAIGRTKKRAYLTAIRALGLLRDVEWHASSPDEEVRIRRLVPRAAIHVAPNLRRPSGENLTRTAPSPPGSVRVVFLSRISQKKNLGGALRLLASCTAAIDFDIYGRQEDLAYWHTCERAIEALPPNVRCRYRGVVDHDDVGNLLAGYDLLLLPTQGENFGHVIGEALEAGCLALISDRTPWRGLAARDAGWDLPLGDPAAFTAAIEEYARLGAAERARRRARARELAAARDRDVHIVDQNARLFTAPPPDAPRRR